MALCLPASVASAFRAEWRRSRRLTHGLLGVCLVVVVVGLVFAYAIVSQAHRTGGGASGFVLFGQQFAGVIKPPADVRPIPGGGYDGQYYYVLATDPLLLHRSTLARLDGQTFRAERIGYPIVAALLSHLMSVRLLVSLLLTNLLVCLGGTLLFAEVLRRRGQAVLWAAAYGLLPGFLLATMRDLTDPLAMTLAAAGLLAWILDRPWLAAACLAAAVITREVAILVPLAFACDTAIQAWVNRAAQGVARARLARVWPVIVLPTVTYAVWHAYMYFRGVSLASGASTGVPFLSMVRQIQSELHGGAGVLAIWDAAFLLLTIVALLVAAHLAVTRPNPASLTALLMGATILINVPADFWADTRIALGLFVPLLIVGLEQRSRVALVLSGTAAAMTPVLLVLMFGVG